MAKWVKRTALLTLPIVASLLTTAAPASAAADSSATTVTFWGDWSGQGEKQIDAMVNRFNKTHTNIQVKYIVQQDLITKFLTATTAGNAPDLMIWDRWHTALYAPKGVLQPVDSFMKNDGVSKTDFLSEPLRELSWNGNLYGLPMTVDCRALFYNKKMFAAAGIKNPPATWAQLEQDAVKLTKWNGNKLVQSGFTLDDVGLFSMWLRQAGGEMVSTDGSKTTFNNAKGLAVLNFWNKLLNKDKVYQTGFATGLPNGLDAFSAGKAAMVYSGPWMINAYKQYTNLDFGISQPPAGPNGNKGAGMGGFGLAIPTAAKNKQAAWEFEKWWLANAQNAMYWAQESDNLPGYLPVLNSPILQKDKYWKPIIDTLKYAKIRPPFAGYADMEGKATIPNFQLFLANKETAKQALSNAQKQGDQILQQENVH